MSEETKHTPVQEKWYADFGFPGKCNILSDRYAGCIATLIEGNEKSVTDGAICNPIGDEFRSNGYTIAASKNMLAALKGNLSHMKRIEASNESCGHPFDEDNAEQIETTKAAIAKAEGRAR